MLSVTVHSAHRVATSMMIIGYSKLKYEQFLLVTEHIQADTVHRGNEVIRAGAHPHRGNEVIRAGAHPHRGNKVIRAGAHLF